MSEKPIQGTEESLKTLAIEGSLPLKAIGIENLKEDNPKHLPPHRYLHPWFARRPTPATRLAILASVLPQGMDSDKILDLIQIGPRQETDVDIAAHVEKKKATEDSRSGNLEDHYGYPRPYTRTPSPKQLDDLHETLRDHWDGDLPTVLDPTAGGGVIPFESLRYGLPTQANELNPIPTTILKAMLDYPLSVGSLREDLEQWAKKIDEIGEEYLNQYFPEPVGVSPSHYAGTYTVSCPSCGCDMPLTPNWWLRKQSSNKGIAVRPTIDDGEISYERVSLPDEVKKSEFNPQDGTRSRGGNTTCLNCGVVTESKEIKEQLRAGQYNVEILGVKYIDREGNSGYRAPTDQDYEALNAAAEKVESDYSLFSLLDREIPPNGQKTSEPVNHGMSQWRDLFTPRQLLSHYYYWRAFESVKEEIRMKYDNKRAEAILTVLSFAGGKLIDRNSRLSPYSIKRGYPENAVGGKNYSFQWMFVDNNPSAGDQCYADVIERIINSYEDLVRYLDDVDVEPVNVQNADAADLSYEDDSIQAAVVDPPYYSSIMYAELSDIFYVWMEKYLNDIHPSLFEAELTDKESEAVANPSRFSEVAGKGQSKKELAKQSYESKMSDIFSRLYEVLETGGVMTVMFTHKESDAWDTLTMSLIKSGFTITATHPITSEMPYRMDMQGRGSADSTLLLTGRKTASEKIDPEERPPTLWSDVQTDTREAAKKTARELLDSGLSLTKTDVIISAFGPTLRVFADSYPVVDDQDNKVLPRKALGEARTAVTQVLVNEYLEADGIDNLDEVTEWYILCWLVYESETFSYDEGHQLGLGIGVDIDDIKRNTKTWRKSTGDIKLRSHTDRVQNINEKPEDRSNRIPVNPDELSFSLALDKVHAAMRVYDAQGESACCDWLRERNFDTDSTFKATLKALLQVLPHDHDDWELARDLASGRTQDVLNLEFSPNVFTYDEDDTQQSQLTDH